MAHWFVAQFCRLATLTKRRRSATQQGWYPPALRWWSLIAAICTCWVFMAFLQIYLFRSNRDGGIIFATSINDLPLRRSFVYLYMPTVIAVLFSIFIVWIDNDAKRFEPYRQMSKPNGALGKNSILLHYPFDFIPFVPLYAFHRRHWLVFSASLATILTTFGVVPLQAGLFSTEMVVRISPQAFSMSQRNMPLDTQEERLGLDYAWSAYGILNLNETLPAFMSRDYTLRPFKMADRHGIDTPGTWTASTTLYSMDLLCKPLEPKFGIDQVVSPDGLDEQGNYFNESVPTVTFNMSAPDCRESFRNFNNDTIGAELDALEGRLVPVHSSRKIKTYSSIYYGQFSWDDRIVEETPSWPLCSHHSMPADGIFMAIFLRNKRRAEDPPPYTFQAISCTPSYYHQEVNATIDSITHTPVEVTRLTDKQPLPSNIFNTTAFEHTVASGTRTLKYRKDDLPLSAMPRYIEQLHKIDLTPVQPYEGDDEGLTPISAMALTASPHQLEDFLDPKILGQAYEAAYRLLFARAMTDVLKVEDWTETVNITGGKVERHEAVVLEPVFTHLVTGLLGCVSVLMFLLLYMSSSHAGSRSMKVLHDDPGSIAAVMTLVADSRFLLAQFEGLECCTAQDLQQNLEQRRYNIEDQNRGSCIVEGGLHQTLQPSTHKSSIKMRVMTPRRPTEFRMITAVPFISLFVVLIVALAVLFVQSRLDGLPLPSANTVIQNVVRAYIPTAVATLIEPMWILINRLLCILQPLEELRGLKALASSSLTLNYASVPPQLTIFKAARVGHYVLMAVGLMSLLANVLATTFAGLLYQKNELVGHSAVFSPPFDARVVKFNASHGSAFEPVESDNYQWELSLYQGAVGDAQFLVLDSNYTRNASLPSWTDGLATYLPFRAADTDYVPAEQQYEAYTRYSAGEPNCKPLVFGEDYLLRLWSRDPLPSGWLSRYDTSRSTLQVKVPSQNGTLITCTALLRHGDSFGERLGFQSRDPEEENMLTCREGRTSAELLTILGADEGASTEDFETCMTTVAVGWMRANQRKCSHPNLDGSAPDDFEEANSTNTFMMACQPKVTVGTAQVRVDASGVLQTTATDLQPDPDQSPSTLDKYFSSGLASFIAQSNLFVFNSQRSPWHNHSFANEYFHYFINRAAGDLKFTDPNEPLPTWEDVKTPVDIAYKRLFSVWMSVNMDFLFIPATNATQQIEGTYRTLEERLFVSKPLFIISEIILGIYVIVSIIVYRRRPGQYLARVPTSIAAVIALFASSAAVKDLQGTAHMTNKEREQYLKDLNDEYGYGSYIGSDGAVHVGIEKVPYVQYMKKVGFEGTRIGRELKRRKDKGSTTTSTEYINVPLVDEKKGRMVTASVTESARDTQGSTIGYMALEGHPLAASLAESRGANRSHVTGDAHSVQGSGAEYTALPRHSATDEDAADWGVEVARSLADARRPAPDYKTLVGLNEMDERSVSPLEESTVNTCVEQREGAADILDLSDDDAERLSHVTKHNRA